MAGIFRLSKRIAFGWLIALIVLFGAISNVNPVRADGSEGTGPGGVGSANGASNLQLWLKADAGVYTDDGCTTAAENGNSVACWADQSGYGNHFTQSTSGSRPSLVNSVLSSEPILRFDGSSQFLKTGYSAGINSHNFTIFIVARHTATTSALKSPFSNLCWGSNYEGYYFYATEGGRWDFMLHNGSVASTQIGVDASDYSWHIHTGFLDSNESQYLEIDGTNLDSDPVYNFTSNQSCETFIGSGSDHYNSPAYYFPGDIAEVIIYNTSLNLAQRVLVNNYLSAKYTLVINNDKYSDGDPSYITDVAGIGKDSDGAEGSNNTASSAGMTFVNQSFVQDNGDYILFGHNSNANGNTSDELPSTGDWADGNNHRWSRTWYLQKTDKDTPDGTVDITFDISDSGMGGSFGGSAGNYRLLKRSDSSGAFSDICSATSINGDQVLFDNVDTTLLGSYFTLGTVDNASSPTAIRLQDFQGRRNQIFLIAGLFCMAIIGICLLFGWRRRLHRL